MGGSGLKPHIEDSPDTRCGQPQFPLFTLPAVPWKEARGEAGMCKSGTHGPSLMCHTGLGVFTSVAWLGVCV